MPSVSRSKKRSARRSDVKEEVGVVADAASRLVVSSSSSFSTWSCSSCSSCSSSSCCSSSIFSCAAASSHSSYGSSTTSYSSALQSAASSSVRAASSISRGRASQPSEPPAPRTSPPSSRRSSRPLGPTSTFSQHQEKVDNSGGSSVTSNGAHVPPGKPPFRNTSVPATLPASSPSSSSTTRGSAVDSGALGRRSRRGAPPASGASFTSTSSAFLSFANISRSTSRSSSSLSSSSSEEYEEAEPTNSGKKKTRGRRKNGKIDAGDLRANGSSPLSTSPSAVEPFGSGLGSGSIEELRRSSSSPVEDGDREFGDALCPVCLEELDETDRILYPCECGYQLCLWCFHYIRVNMGNKCPACRRDYDEEKFQYDKRKQDQLIHQTRHPSKAVAQHKLAEHVQARSIAAAVCTQPSSTVPCATVTSSSVLSSSGTGSTTSSTTISPSSTVVPGSSETFSLSRVIASSVTTGSSASSSQKVSGLRLSRLPLSTLASLHHARLPLPKLVMILGLPASMIHKKEELRRFEYFGRYGKIVNLSVYKTPGSGSGWSATAAYITYTTEEEAQAAIRGVDGIMFQDRILRATHGTTKYCPYFLEDYTCTNPDCHYVHTLAKQHIPLCGSAAGAKPPPAIVAGEGKGDRRTSKAAASRASLLPSPPLPRPSCDSPKQNVSPILPLPSSTLIPYSRFARTFFPPPSTPSSSSSSVGSSTTSFKSSLHAPPTTSILGCGAQHAYHMQHHYHYSYNSSASFFPYSGTDESASVGPSTSVASKKTITSAPSSTSAGGTPGNGGGRTTSWASIAAAGVKSDDRHKPHANTTPATTSSSGSSGGSLKTGKSSASATKGSGAGGGGGVLGRSSQQGATLASGPSSASSMAPATFSTSNSAIPARFCALSFASSASASSTHGVKPRKNPAPRQPACIPSKSRTVSVSITTSSSISTSTQASTSTSLNTAVSSLSCPVSSCLPRSSSSTVSSPAEASLSVLPSPASMSSAVSSTVGLPLTSSVPHSSQIMDSPAVSMPSSSSFTLHPAATSAPRGLSFSSVLPSVAPLYDPAFITSDFGRSDRMGARCLDLDDKAQATRPTGTAPPSFPSVLSSLPFSPFPSFPAVDISSLSPAISSSSSLPSVSCSLPAVAPSAACSSADPSSVLPFIRLPQEPGQRGWPEESIGRSRFDFVSEDKSGERRKRGYIREGMGDGGEEEPEELFSIPALDLSVNPSPGFSYPQQPFPVSPLDRPAYRSPLPPCAMLSPAYTNACSVVPPPHHPPPPPDLLARATFYNYPRVLAGGGSPAGGTPPPGASSGSDCPEFAGSTGRPVGPVGPYDFEYSGGESSRKLIGFRNRYHDSYYMSGMCSNSVYGESEGGLSFLRSLLPHANVSVAADSSYRLKHYVQSSLETTTLPQSDLPSVFPPSSYSGNDYDKHPSVYTKATSRHVATHPVPSSLGSAAFSLPASPAAHFSSQTPHLTPHLPHLPVPADEYGGASQELHPPASLIAHSSATPSSPNILPTSDPFLQSRPPTTPFSPGRPQQPLHPIDG